MADERETRWFCDRRFLLLACIPVRILTTVRNQRKFTAIPSVELRRISPFGSSGLSRLWQWGWSWSCVREGDQAPWILPAAFLAVRPTPMNRLCRAASGGLMSERPDDIVVPTPAGRLPKYLAAVMPLGRKHC